MPDGLEDVLKPSRPPSRRTPLTIARILAWADDHHRRTGRWPTQRSGRVPRAGLTWIAIASALREGLRGLPGNDTLAGLLARERGAQPASGPYHRRALSLEDVLRWADAHRRKTGRWPNAASGPVAGVPGETWGAINQALLWGRRGLPGGSSLSRLLFARHGRKHSLRRPPLTVSSILAWAAAHRHRTGRWPTAASGPVAEAPGVTWNAVNLALAAGNRGLPHCGSLARLLRLHARVSAPA
jgi:hypothetical protein